MIEGVKLLKRAGCAAIVLFLFLLPLFVKGQYYLHILIVVGVNVILASSLRIMTTTGQFSLGHAGFMAIGAYTSALLTMELNLSFWVSLPLGGIASGLLALIIGYPFVRVKRAYFAMLTLFTGEVIRLVITEWRDLTGGSTGLLDIPPPNPLIIPGLLGIGFTSKEPYYYLVLVLVLMTLLFFYRMERTRILPSFLAIQQDDSVAESVGIDTAGSKVLALCVGCFFAGIAGSFYAHYVLVLSPGSFMVLQSIYLMVYVMVGGRRSFSGPIWGALILTFIPEVFRGLKEYQPFIFSGTLFVIIFCLPAGLAGLPHVAEMVIRKRGRESSGVT